MAVDLEVYDDVVRRADTSGAFPKGHDGGGAEPTGRGFTGFVRRYRKLFSILLAILIFALAFLVVLLFGRDSTYRKIRDRVDEAFVYHPFAPYPTVSSEENDDHVEVLSKMIYKHLPEYDIDQEVNTYIEFNAFNFTYDRSHASVSEKIKKLLIFRDNMKAIREHNAKPDRKFTMGMNHFGDMTTEEFLSLQRSKLTLPLNAEHHVAVGENLDLPLETTMNVSNVHVQNDDDIDYRRGDYMTPVKDQGRCGSCWAFGAIGVFEPLLKKKNLSNVTLSEQELVDCVSECEGCNGGNPYYSFDYLTRKGTHLGSDYPYVAKDETCRKVDKSPWKLNRFGFTLHPNLVALLKQRGPLTVLVSVVDSWRFYKSGVLDACGDDVNHAIVLAGVGLDKGGKYWILKNSWGPDWGEGGYVRLERESSKFDAECGLNIIALYPIS